MKKRSRDGEKEGRGTRREQMKEGWSEEEDSLGERRVDGGNRGDEGCEGAVGVRVSNCRSLS